MSKRNADGNKYFEVFPCTKEDYCLLVIAPERSVLFYGCSAIHCLGGDVRLDGFQVRASSWSWDKAKMIPLCAPYVEGRPLVIDALNLTDEQGVNHKPARLKYRLKEVTNLYEDIMTKWGKRKPAVLLVYRRPTALMDIVEQLYGNIFTPPNTSQTCHFERIFITQAHLFSYVPESMQEIKNKVQLINNKRRDGERCTILPYGRKDAGKSTFVRILANQLMNPDLPPVYLLDCDVGQTELTPPGCLSLWKLDQPLLGHPWSHQKTEFSSSYFFGDTQVADDQFTYLNIFDTLLNEFRAKSEPGSVLLINPLGWLEGAGAEIFRHIANAACPQFYFHISAGPHGVRDDIRCVPTHNSSGIQNTTVYRSNFGKVYGKMVATELRNLRLISYFSQLLKSPVISTLSQADALKVPFSKLTIAMPMDLADIADEFMLASLNGQIVALCSSAESLETRHLLERTFLPSVAIVKADSPLLRCHGFAIVRAVDIVKQQVVILTPISKKTLSEVTVIARGLHIPVPPVIMRSSNGQPALYSTSSTQSRGESTISSNLYDSLKTNSQSLHHRAHFPGH